MLRLILIALLIGGGGISAHGEIISKALWSAWDHTPCYSLITIPEHYEWRYTILDAMRDLESDIGQDMRIYAKPVPGCIDIKTIGTPMNEGTGRIFGEAICNTTKPIKECHIKIYLPDLSLKKAYVVTKHEMFHTMGFGHLTSTKMTEFPAVITSNSLMLSQTNGFNKFTSIEKFVFEHKYGNDGFGGWNNYTIGDIVIPKNIVIPK